MTVNLNKRALTLVLPWPPSVNRVWRAVQGRVILAADARAYSKALASRMPTGLWQPFTGRLEVVMSLHPPTTLKNRKWDIANREKLLCDSLTKQRIWLDDSQIDKLTIKRGRFVQPCPEGYCYLEIEEVA